MVAIGCTKKGERFMDAIPDEVIDFVTKWGVATGQDPVKAVHRFWELMVNPHISEEAKDETIRKWAKEAGFGS
jgi:hypothetical protein